LPIKGAIVLCTFTFSYVNVFYFRQSYDVTIDLAVEGTNQSSKNTLDLKNPYFRYTGAPVQPPPGISNVSPSENYWSQLDAQGVRNGIFEFYYFLFRQLNV
jgi:hypothetical protein